MTYGLFIGIVLFVRRAIVIPYGGRIYITRM